GAAVARPVDGAVAARVDAAFEREAAEGTRRRRGVDPVHTVLYPREFAPRGAGLEPERGELTLVSELAAARHLPRRPRPRRRRAIDREIGGRRLARGHGSGEWVRAGHRAVPRHAAERDAMVAG